MVSYPPKVCPAHSAHYWKQISKYVWTCLYCGSPIWLPNTFAESDYFTDLIKRVGLVRAYNTVLETTSSSKDLIECILAVKSLQSQYTREECQVKCIEIFKVFKDNTDKDHLVDRNRTPKALVMRGSKDYEW
jgi:hypothetical protein